jgi:hypothetical protein
VNDSSSYLGALVCLAALGYGGYWYYTEYQASAGMSGKTFYETCWEYKKKPGPLAPEPKPSNPYQAAQWKNCDPVVEREMYEQGLIFVGTKPGEDEDQLRAVCPHVGFPIAGLSYWYVEDTEAAGGLSTLSAFLPASWSVRSWAKKRWPNCSNERERQGYPKIVEKAPGVYGWEKPCPRCK